MITKYDSNDKVWVMATIRKAEKVKDKIYYTINESEYIVPEELCRKCTEEEIGALKEAKRNYQCAVVDSSLSYSSLQNQF